MRFWWGPRKASVLDREGKQGQWEVYHAQVLMKVKNYAVRCPPKFNFWILLVFLAFDVVVLQFVPAYAIEHSSFRLNNQRKARKRCSHSIFSSSAIIIDPSLPMCDYHVPRGFLDFFSAWECCETASERLTRVANPIRRFVKRKIKKISGTMVMCESYQRESDISKSGFLMRFCATSGCYLTL